MIRVRVSLPGESIAFDLYGRKIPLWRNVVVPRLSVERIFLFGSKRYTYLVSAGNNAYLKLKCEDHVYEASPSRLVASVIPSNRF